MEGEDGLNQEEVKGQYLSQMDLSPVGISLLQTATVCVTVFIIRKCFGLVLKRHSH